MADHTVLYDGDCSVCQAIVAVLLSLDRRRRLRPVALQSSQAATLLSHMSPEQRLASLHVVGPGAEILSSGAALERLAALLSGRDLRGGRHPVAWRRAYLAVAGHREAFGKLVGKRTARWASTRIQRAS